MLPVLSSWKMITTMLPILCWSHMVVSMSSVLHLQQMIVTISPIFFSCEVIVTISLSLPSWQNKNKNKNKNNFILHRIFQILALSYLSYMTDDKDYISCIAIMPDCSDCSYIFIRDGNGYVLLLSWYHTVIVVSPYCLGVIW